MDALVTRLDELGDLAARRAAVSADPAQAATAARLAELAAAAGSRQAEAEQLGEALEAAEHARMRLLEAAGHLGGAGDWATFDTFFGGGMLTDMAKYDRLDHAAALMREADAALGRLAHELADVGMQQVGDIGISELTGFFDVWFDDIFSDWAVRDRIGRAAGRVAEVGSAVEATLAELEVRLAASAEEQARLARERETVLSR